MAELVEGIWKCKVLSGVANADEKTGIVTVCVNVEILEGPDKGRRATYEEPIDFRSAKYVVMSAKAVGWRGATPIEGHFASDVEEWISQSGGETTLEVKHILIGKGKKAGTYWGKPRSLGRQGRKLVAPTAQASAEANEALMAALAEDGGQPDDAPPSDIPDTEIPF